MPKRKNSVLYKLSFPSCRPRRLRQTAALRRLVAETRLSKEALIMPYFVREGRGIKEPINAMPGQYRFSSDRLLNEIEDLQELGIRSVLLFGIPESRDAEGSQAVSAKGVIPKTLRILKKNFPEMVFIPDLCFCAYTSHGHCGLIDSRGEIANDVTLKKIARAAAVYAEAGADMLAPSDMMDGRIRAIRNALDVRGFESLPLMSYSAKYASAFYGPFREAAHSAPKPQAVKKVCIPKDRKTYQMDIANAREALKEMALDLEEGADILMVKPALAYLDIIRRARETFPVPIAAYSVSGEYSMIKAAAEKGYGDEKSLVWETAAAVFRAGASILITYYAKKLAGWINP